MDGIILNSEIYKTYLNNLAQSITKRNTDFVNQVEFKSEEEITVKSAQITACLEKRYIDERLMPYRGQNEGSGGEVKNPWEYEISGKTELYPLEETYKLKVCPYCGGSKTVVCPDCMGKGSYKESKWNRDLDRDLIQNVLCKRCNGTGALYCNDCDGVGSVIYFKAVAREDKKINKKIDSFSKDIDKEFKDSVKELEFKEFLKFKLKAETAKVNIKAKENDISDSFIYGEICDFIEKNSFNDMNDECHTKYFEVKCQKITFNLVKYQFKNKIYSFFYAKDLNQFVSVSSPDKKALAETVLKKNAPKEKPVESSEKLKTESPEMTSLKLQKNESEDSKIIPKKSSGISSKSRTTALLLCFFLGVFSAHRFYAGRTKSGFLQIILNCLIVGFFWYYVDFFLILFGKFKDSDNDYIRNW